MLNHLNILIGGHNAAAVNNQNNMVEIVEIKSTWPYVMRARLNGRYGRGNWVIDNLESYMPEIREALFGRVRPEDDVQAVREDPSCVVACPACSDDLDGNIVLGRCDACGHMVV
jgi:hypothetical protein